MKDWTKKPTITDVWEKEADYVMFLDENNCEDITNITNKISRNLPISNDEKFFTLTGCIINQFEYKKLKDSFLALKSKYWENRKYYTKNNEPSYICFHSNDIRRKQPPFNQAAIDCELFGKELFETIQKIDFKIISITINIYEYLLQNYKFSLYHTSFDFLLERLIYALPNDKKIVLMFEARGKKEDKRLHEHICSVIKNTGVRNITPAELTNKIIGVYFNPKWKNNSNPPYSGLELADLCSYPIHKFIKTGNKDKAFSAIESKINCYPNYLGRGIKVFPKNKIEAT